MRVLVVNTGSTSLKFQCIDTDSGASLCKGNLPIAGPAEEAIHRMLDQIGPEQVARLDAVGHRVVHGGAEIDAAVLVTPELEKLIEKYAPLAPLHNAANLQGIRILRALLPAVKQAAVFDTAFHVTIPEEAYLYGLNYAFYERYGIRRFGFHGPSHQYVFHRAAALLGIAPESCNAITCHMGGGVSLSAIRGGVAVDTSLGFGTAAGVPMGTRAGDVDTAAILYMFETLGMTAAEVRKALYEESGLLGLSGVSADLREILKAAAKGNRRAELALKVFVHAVRKQIAGLAGSLGGRLSAVVFTAGIGESSPDIRQRICAGLEVLGLQLDAQRNATCFGQEAVISRADSRVAAFVVPTNEEAVIAEQTAKIMAQAAALRRG